MEGTVVMINDTEYYAMNTSVPLAYSLADVDNADYKMRSSFRSVRNCSHITSSNKHLVVAMSPQLGKLVVCYHNGKFFITKPNDTEDGMNIEDVTEFIIAVADLL